MKNQFLKVIFDDNTKTSFVDRIADFLADLFEAEGEIAAIEVGEEEYKNGEEEKSN